MGLGERLLGTEGMSGLEWYSVVASTGSPDGEAQNCHWAPASPLLVSCGVANSPEELKWRQ